jgi:1-acyl-sn-glycerol-3-phosphate acyltransferase
VAVLAAATGVPVVPLYVHGLADVMPKGSRAPLPGGVVVDVGQPVRPGPGDDVASIRDRVEATLRRLSDRRPDWGGRDEAADAEARGRTGEGY